VSVLLEEVLEEVTERLAAAEEEGQRERVSSLYLHVKSIAEDRLLPERFLQKAELEETVEFLLEEIEVVEAALAVEAEDGHISSMTRCSDHLQQTQSIALVELAGLAVTEQEQERVEMAELAVLAEELR